MSNKLLVVMDLGRFKAYKMEESAHFSHPRLLLLEEWATEVQERLSDELSDQAGRFSKGSLPSGAGGEMSNGEQHNLELEQRRRAVKRMATRIGQLWRREPFEGCYLAAGKEINAAVLEAMDPATRAEVQKNVTANLVRLNPSEIVTHFWAPQKTGAGPTIPGARPSVRTG